MQCGQINTVIKYAHTWSNILCTDYNNAHTCSNILCTDYNISCPNS